MLKSVSEKISKIQYASVWEEAVFKSTKVRVPFVCFDLLPYLTGPL
jgi:hypothetical protein